MAFYWPYIKDNFELWRLATCFLFVGKFSFNTLIACYTLVQFSKMYELGGPFNTGAGGGTADYAFMLLFCSIAVLVTYPLFGAVFPVPPYFATTLIYLVLYVWSKRNPTANANIWGIPVPGVYLPFASLALRVFMGQNYMDMIHGMIIGHVYYFLVDVVPQVQGKDFLHTPQFLIEYFGIGEYRPEQQRVAQPPQAGGGARGFQQSQRPGGTPSGGTTAGGSGAAAAGGGGGHNWGGGGRALGRS